MNIEDTIVLLGGLSVLLLVLSIGAGIGAPREVKIEREEMISGMPREERARVA